jgi:hypothetical protein
MNGRPMSFTLYNAPQSTCSQRVRFVLNAKKISFAEIKLVAPVIDHDGNF